MKRVLGLLLALAVMVGMSNVPSFSQPQEKKEKKAQKAEKKGEKKDEMKKDEPK